MLQEILQKADRMDKQDSREYVCKRVYRKQTKWTNKIVECRLQEFLQKADKIDKPDSRGYVARDFT